MEDEIDVSNVVSRWTTTGLLDGLPTHEKIELSGLYDVMVKIILSNGIDKTNPTLEETILLVTRRIYRRVGSDFDYHHMVDSLKTFLENKTDDDIKNEYVKLIVEFSDTYSDDVILKGEFTDEEYKVRVERLLKTVGEILLSDKLISGLNTEDKNSWVINYSDHVKSGRDIRRHNQKIATEILQQIIKETNKGI